MTSETGSFIAATSRSSKQPSATTASSTVVLESCFIDERLYFLILLCKANNLRMICILFKL